jgi:cytochrome d ubiquinol oxidase subunit I
MDILTAARAQMTLSLGFHMVFAATGIGLPLLMLIAEGLWLWTRKPHYRDLARKWGKATGLLFAIGAVSGTALSFELGLLWPRLMEKAGSIVGPAFALEGFAFFIEAIFLGLYLYGWDRLPPIAHWMTGVPVAASGLLSGILVVAVNAWMQVPVGFEIDEAGRFVNVDPLATFRSPAWVHMAIHSSLSCYIATAFAVAGVYAYGLLRGRNDAYHHSALGIALGLGTVTALLQPLSGDFSGQRVAKYQPIKLAAMEALFETQAGAPLVIGGIPDEKAGKVRFAIEIPYLLSLLVAHDPQAIIKGLNDFPIEERPNVMLVHLAYQIMVGSGLVMIAVGLVYWWVRWRRQVAQSRVLLYAVVLAAPLGFLALEAGWFVTEVGRQPWTIYHVMRTSAAVTSAADVPSSLFAFTVLYLGLAVTVVLLLLKLAQKPGGATPLSGKEAHGT